eukprot:1434670-Amphidinium_carterae.1
MAFLIVLILETHYSDHWRGYFAGFNSPYVGRRTTSIGCNVTMNSFRPGKVVTAIVFVFLMLQNT